MSEGRSLEEFDLEKIKEYTANASRVGSAVESLRKHDGWQIFMALYKRRKDEIKDKDDDAYENLVDFKADRRALKIIDGILVEMEGFISDADEAVKSLMGISEEDTTQPRGIMLIEAMEDANREV